MPKPLRQEETTDRPIAKIINSENTAAVLGRASTNPPAPPNQTTPKLTGEPVNIAKEFHLTRTASLTLKKSVGIFEDATGGLTNSHFLRALLMVVEDAM